MEPKPISEKDFAYIYSRVPRLCVDLVVRSGGGIILTLRSLPTWHNFWHLPGGTVRYQEPIAVAAARIAKAELNITVAVKKVLGYIEYPSEQTERGFGWSVSLPLLCEFVSGRLKVNDEAAQARVFAELPDKIISEQADFLKNHWSEIFS